MADRDLSEQVKEFLSQRRSNILSKVDAKIHFIRSWDQDQNQYVTYYRWIGGKIAAISDEVMAEISTKPDVGDVIELGELLIVLTERSPLGDFWFVKQTILNDSDAESGRDGTE